MIPVTQILAGIAAFAVIFVLGCANGYIIRDSAAKTAAAKAHKAAYDQLKEKQGEIDVLSAKYEATKAAADRKHLERTNTIREYYTQGPTVSGGRQVVDTSAVTRLALDHLFQREVRAQVHPFSFITMLRSRRIKVPAAPIRIISRRFRRALMPRYLSAQTASCVSSFASTLSALADAGKSIARDMIRSLTLGF